MRLCAQRDHGKLSHAYLVVFDDPKYTKTALREIAKAILSVDRSSIADPRKMIEDLNRDFEEKMEALLQP